MIAQEVCAEKFLQNVRVFPCALIEMKIIYACASFTFCMAGRKQVLFNKTRKKIISKNVRFASTPWQKMRGMMFRRKPGYALVFKTRFPGRASLSIHMLFVFFSIDVVYLRNSRAVDIRKRVRPFTLFILPAKESDTLIELPAGSIEHGKIRVGDIIELKAA